MVMTMQRLSRLSMRIRMPPIRRTQPNQLSSGNSASSAASTRTFGRNIGIATLSSDRDTRPRLMAAADAALYRAKDEGRKRVCVEP
jgi:GGDEF domain-containing protein